MGTVLLRLALDLRRIFPDTQGASRRVRRVSVVPFPFPSFPWLWQGTRVGSGRNSTQPLARIQRALPSRASARNVTELDCEAARVAKCVCQRVSNPLIALAAVQHP